MKIIKLTLSKYSRFDLLGCETMHYTPQSPYQLFTGKNGIGKSSLLYELSPLPCESTDLKEGGYKYIEIEHRHHHYKLTYTLDKKLHSSFIRDDKELNEGGTIKVQKDLIKEYFNYDINIHDILTGYTLLTNMSPQIRREWFTKMSQSDVSYAINLFGRLKSAERDIKGAIKLNQQRLVEEQTKLPKADEIQQIKKANNEHKENIQHLMGYLHKYDNNDLVAIDTLGNLCQAIEACSVSIMDLNLESSYKGMSDNDDLLRYKHEAEYALETSNKRYKAIMDELSELHDLINIDNRNNSLSLEDLEKRIAELTYLLNENRKLLHEALFEVGNDVNIQLTTYTQLHNDLLACLTEMPNNPLSNGERLYTKHAIDILEDKVSTLHQEKSKVGNRIQVIEAKLVSMKQIHDVDCPQCQHRFKPGVDCDKVKEGEILLNTLKKQYDDLEKQYDISYQNLQDQYLYRKHLNRLKEIRDRYPEHIRLFQYIFQNKIDTLYDTPYQLVNVLDQYRQTLEIVIEIGRLEEEYNEVKNNIERKRAATSVDRKFIDDRCKTLENELIAVTERFNELTLDIRKVTEVLSNQQTLKSYMETLKSHYNNLVKQNTMEVLLENNHKAKAIMEDIQRKYVINEQRVTQVNQSEMVIDTLSKTNEKLVMEQKYLQLLLTLLSPQDGLIAESMLGFIHQFLEEMTNVIDQIWVYTMRPYLELTEDGIDLDYRFKVEIENNESPVKDVSRLSRGQKEIMDFVFKLLLMQHMDYRDYPLFMDEIGGSFDNHHRDRLYQYVKTLVESHQVEQVFIISHIASSHESLSSADKCVLDTDAVMQDGTVNKVIEFC